MSLNRSLLAFCFVFGIVGRPAIGQEVHDTGRMAIINRSHFVEMATDPTLSETMRFVRDKVLGIGRMRPDALPINYALSGLGWETYSDQITDLSFDASTCRMQVVEVETGWIPAMPDGMPARMTATNEIPLQDVSNITVEADTVDYPGIGKTLPHFAFIDGADGQETTQMYTLTLFVRPKQSVHNREFTEIAKSDNVDRERRMLEQNFPNPKVFKERKSTEHNNDRAYIKFTNKALADRVSNALSHAAALCRVEHPNSPDADPSIRKPGEPF